MGGLLLLSKPFDCFSYTLKKQNVIAYVDLKYHQFAIAEVVQLIIKLITLFSFMYVVCTPVGLSRMFTVMGQLLVKPTVSDQYLWLFCK